MALGTNDLYQRIVREATGDKRTSASIVSLFRREPPVPVGRDCLQIHLARSNSWILKMASAM